jgi:hypothetical protein
MAPRRLVWAALEMPVGWNFWFFNNCCQLFQESNRFLCQRHGNCPDLAALLGCQGGNHPWCQIGGDSQLVIATGAAVDDFCDQLTRDGARRQHLVNLA